MIKAVIFDYFGVVSSDEYWQAVGADKDDNDAWHSLADDVNLGRMHWQEFIAAVSAKSGKRVSEIEQIYAREKINPEMIACIKSLRVNYKTGLLTNAHHEFIEPILKRSHIDELFDAVIVSSRVGAIKPAREIYQAALGALSVTASEAVFIDDIERNVHGAEAVGLKAIYYKNIKQLKSELSALLDA